MKKKLLRKRLSVVCIAMVWCFCLVSCNSASKERNVNASDVDITDSKSSSGDDWDKILDSYEKFIDDYIRLYKKVQAGDTKAMTKYAAMMESAIEFAEKLEGAKNKDLSSTQMARYLKLQTKLATELLEADEL